MTDVGAFSPFSLCGGGKLMKKSDLLVLSCLRKDARMKLTEMSRITRVPVSTCFDRIRALEDEEVVRRHGCLVSFEKLGF